MKKLLSSVAVLAAGAALAPSAPAQDKPWNVSASLRGFYDDNYTTVGSGVPGGKLSSFGFELSPSVSYRLRLDPTDVTASYKYGLRYFEDRSKRNTSSADHSHDVNLKLVHQFPERYRLEVSDNFVVAQEQALLASGTLVRANGNNIRNVANGNFSGEINPTFGYDLTYSNTFYDYQSKGPNSFSALLDRVEHLMGGNVRWNATESITALVGYRYGIVDMSSNELISNPAGVGGFAPASSRDNTSHYGFVGVDHLITRQLKASARVGLQYTEFSKAIPSDSTVSPYVDVSGTWEYLPGSALMLGVKHARNATDVSAGTLDAESSSVYGQWSHKLTPSLTASLVGQYQMSTFNQGVNNDRKENLFLAGVNLGYELIKDRLTAEVGYNFDKIDSDVGGRSFDRNRMYIGVRASY